MEQKKILFSTMFSPFETEGSFLTQEQADHINERTVMYPEFVVCNIAGNCITNAENSTIFYFKSVSTWQEEPTAHVRST